MRTTNFNQNLGIDELEALLPKLAGLSSRDFAAAIGALHLLPENASAAYRLELLAHMVGATKVNEGEELTHEALKELIQSELLNQPGVLFNEDPCENIFVEELPFIGGGYRFLPGPTEETSFISRLLARAIFFGPMEEGFRRRANGLLLTTLRLSEELVRRSGLTRGLHADTDDSKPIAIPSPDKLETLKASVTFSDDEVNTFLPTLAAAGAVLAPLTCLVDEVDFGELPEGLIHRKPLVKCGQSFVVPIPSALLPAAHHALLLLAETEGHADTVASNFHVVHLASVIESLRILGLQRIKDMATPAVSPPASYAELSYAFDSDKIAVVQVVTDRLLDVQNNHCNGEWGIASQDLEWLSRRQKEIEEQAFSSVNPPNKMLFLVVLQSAGRWYSARFKVETISPVLLLTGAELETISVLEHGKPQCLFNYATADEKTRAEIHSHSQLNKFFFYRQHGYSFYVSDEEPPHFIGITPGFAGEARRVAFETTDRHVVPSYNQGGVVEVHPRFDRSTPISFPIPREEADSALVVECEPIPVWVVGPDKLTNLVNAIAYWIWKWKEHESPFLRDLLSQMAFHSSTLLIKVASEGDLHDTNIVSPSIKIVPGTDGRSLTVMFGAGALKLFDSEENIGERNLVREIMIEVTSLAKGEPGDELKEHLEEVLDDIAPIGRRKMILTIREGLPELEPSDLLPPVTTIDEAVISQVMDEVGEFVRHEHRLPVGPIEQPQEFINRVLVPYYFKHLVQLIGSTDTTSLLKQLMEINESNIRHLAFQSFSLPSQVACFGSNQRTLKELEENLPSVTTAAVSCRFAIEVVAASPSRGPRPVSMELIQRLLCYASLIITSGFRSDVIEHGLANISISLLPSGRIGHESDRYEEATRRFLSAHTVDDLRRSERMYGMYWREQTSSASSPDRDRLDSALAQEIGFTLNEFIDGCGALLDLGRKSDAITKSMTRGEILEELGSSLSWTPAKCKEFVDELSLFERQEFLKPTKPYERRDVYPWRFGRRLSHVRRPLIVLGDPQGDDSLVLWGTRHMFLALRSFVGLVLSGQLTASSPALRQEFGRIHGRAGKAFNDRVYEAVRNLPGLRAKKGVNKIGKLRLADEGRDLGDIDVFVVDEARRRLLAIECKDLSVARTPFEVARERDALFDGDDSARAKHERRITWLKDNLVEVLTSLQLDTTEAWSVSGLIVLDEAILSPHLIEASIPVIPFQSLFQELTT